MGKSKHFKGDRESSRVQELSYKNKELQRVVSKLRRELERYKHGWISSGDEVVEQAEPKKKKDRTCHTCRKGKLAMIRYGKPDGYWYYRSCDLPGCGYRTRSKRLTEEVEE